MNKMEANKRRVALGAFANSVNLSGRIELVMTVIIFMIFGGFITWFAMKYIGLPTYAYFIAFPVLFLIGIYIGKELYLSRKIRANEIKAILEMSTLIGYTIEKLDKIEKAILREMDLVIDIKKDVVKEEAEKEEMKKITVETIQKDIEESTETGMDIKYCNNCNEEVYVAKSMEVCPFCWNKLEVKAVEAEEQLD